MNAIRNRSPQLLASAAALLLMVALPAQAQLYTGNVGDPANPALVGSDLLAPQFVDSASIAQNVAVYDIVVPISEMVTFQSTGFASGGIDPYFSLFSGLAAGGQFLASNYDQAVTGSGGDFTLSYTLAAGDYLIALGVFANLSNAEVLGTGSYSDGFSQLGNATSLGNGSYALQVSLANSANPVPEPSTGALLAAGLLAAAALGRRKCAPGRPQRR